jgi:hypothetical protein
MLQTARIVAVIKELNEDFETEILYNRFYCAGKPPLNSRLYHSHWRSAVQFKAHTIW